PISEIDQTLPGGLGSQVRFARLRGIEESIEDRDLHVHSRGGVRPIDAIVTDRGISKSSEGTDRRIQLVMRCLVQLFRRVRLKFQPKNLGTLGKRVGDQWVHVGWGWGQ